MKLKAFIVLFALSICISTQAAIVDTVQVKSKKMNRNIPCVIISPDKQTGKTYPTLYLLHGYSGNHKTWIGIKPNLPQLVDEYGIIVVCPNGENSWYWDSPINTNSQFETFVSDELIKYIDKNYPSIPNRKKRAITGLSMGGHGAMWLAIRHQDIFGAAGSMSGGLDIRPFPDNWDMKKQIGEEDKNQQIWEEHTVINQLDKLENGSLAIIFDCGYSDFFLTVNKNFHQGLLDRKIDHDFIVRPGWHNAEYWNNSIDYQLLFFNKFFNKKDTKTE